MISCSLNTWRSSDRKTRKSVGMKTARRKKTQVWVMLIWRIPVLESQSEEKGLCSLTVSFHIYRKFPRHP